MAISKKGKASEPAKTDALNIEVTRVKDFSKEDNTAIAFDMKVNGVTIYNCWYREGTNDKGEYTMIAFPSRKDEKTGKYYSHAYVNLSEADKENISKQIEAML